MPTARVSKEMTQIEKRDEFCKIQSVISMKTDRHILGTDIAVPLRNVYIGCHLSTLAHYRIHYT